jgi:hypothetical protein
MTKGVANTHALGGIRILDIYNITLHLLLNQVKETIFEPPSGSNVSLTIASSTSDGLSRVFKS